MRVGLNLVYLVDRAGGAGTYAYELVPALLETDPSVRLTAFVSRDAPEDLRRQPWAGEVDWVELPVRFANRSHLVGQVLGIPAVAARRRLDVVHSLANGGPPLTPGAKKVVTLLDLIGLHQGEQWDSARAVRSMEAFVRVSARLAHRLITISHAARDDLVSTLGLDVDKDGTVSRPSASVRRPASPPTQPRCASASTSARRRSCSASRQEAAVQEPGGARSRHAGPGGRGRGTGSTGSSTEHEGELRRLSDRLGVSERLRFLDWVSDEDLEALYRTATCFVLPSLVEGFGLPVLEAMARGVPVACSDRPALPEVAGDAALLFDPLDQAAVTEAIRRLLRDEALRAQLVEEGWERGPPVLVASNCGEDARQLSAGDRRLIRRAVGLRRRSKGPEDPGAELRLRFAVDDLETRRAQGGLCGFGRVGPGAALPWYSRTTSCGCAFGNRGSASRSRFGAFDVDLHEICGFHPREDVDGSHLDRLLARLGSL